MAVAGGEATLDLGAIPEAGWPGLFGICRFTISRSGGLLPVVTGVGRGVGLRPPGVRGVYGVMVLSSYSSTQSFAVLTILRATAETQRL